jgi:alpha-D-ribose 1-methylphosphonate 5-triphosphate diphosphatase
MRPIRKRNAANRRRQSPPIFLTLLSAGTRGTVLSMCLVVTNVHDMFIFKMAQRKSRMRLGRPVDDAIVVAFTIRVSALTLARLTGRVLFADGVIRSAEIEIADGRIAALRPLAEVADDSLLILPGIIDLHGDAFERQLMPRPRVHFPPVLALVETDRQLLANGITTAYHGLTLSWEPGLRGADAGRDFMAALTTARPHLGCDTRLHLRFETFNLDMVDEVEAWLAEGKVDLLAFNEHTAGIAWAVGNNKSIGELLGRTGLDETTFRALVDRVFVRRTEVPAAVERLAKAAVQAGIPLVSHDDDSPEERAHYRALGCRISEFPADRATASEAIAAGDATVLGAPNVLRGGSHLNRLGAADAAAAGLCSVLSSDYYYPAWLHAPFLLEQHGTLPLAKAWDLVSRNAAQAAGLADRGAIAPGLRADLVLIDDGDRALPIVRATIVAGELRFASAAPPAWYA